MSTLDDRTFRRTGRRACRALVLALTLSALAVSRASADPGQLVSSSAIAGAPSGATAWRIRYRTTDREGRAIESTGVLIAPTTPAPDDGRPVIAWAHGTTGVAEACAPSLWPHAISLIPGLADMMKAGWAIVATDYPGLGTPGPHAYLVGVDAAHAVLDSVRAARHVAGAHTGTRFAVWGLSQGAHAALFTGQEASRYAPDLQLVGVAAAGPPTDLMKNLGAGSNPTARTILMAFAMHSWSQVYHVDLKTIANATTQRVVRRLAATCSSAEPGLRTRIQVLRLRRRLKNLDLSAAEPWRGLLDSNSVGHSPAGAPLFIAQGSADAIVGPAVTKAFVVAACGRQEQVRFVEIPGGIHRETATRSAALTIAWLADRFAGRPAPNDCASLAAHSQP
jgi:alpha-beta hydrolase superfamily lysophospholipase